MIHSIKEKTRSEEAFSSFAWGTGSIRSSTSDPDGACRLGVVLSEYLCERYQLHSITYSLLPMEFTHGWETHTYLFRPFHGAPLPAVLDRELVIRIYPSAAGLDRARREYAVQKYVHGRGVHVAAPLFLEEDPDYFGGPFWIMSYLPGRMLLDELMSRPWRVLGAPAEMAEAHARLHALPPEDFPALPGSFLDRQLLEMETMIWDYDLMGLSHGFDWLVDNRPEPTDEPSILHLDFQPTNLIFNPYRPLGLLDWPEADVGDYHADVATTLMMLDCLPATGSACRQLVAAMGRSMLRRRYLRAYRRIRPLDWNKLSYYRAWAALKRLCHYGRWLESGPIATGHKQSSLNHLTREHLQGMSRYFQRRAGVGVHI
jgi:aminoglycoside phosphotransferase (APT) family kinase protein